MDREWWGSRVTQAKTHESSAISHHSATAVAAQTNAIYWFGVAHVVFMEN